MIKEISEIGYTTEDLRTAANAIMDVFEIYNISHISDLRDLAPTSSLVLPIGKTGRLEITPSNYGSLSKAVVISYYLNGDRKPIIETGIGGLSYPGYFMFRCQKRIDDGDYFLIIHNNSKNVIHERAISSIHPNSLRFSLEELLGKIR